jgi:hypothetical protein
VRSLDVIPNPEFAQQVGRSLEVQSSFRKVESLCDEGRRAGASAADELSATDPSSKLSKPEIHEIDGT